ncbi:MAG: tyrosine-type recombinase/integrase [Leptospiraceae bacterium]|nr:tyrosine-type recombinase/integrase [Leptospiraceae bacterium]
MEHHLKLFLHYLEDERCYSPLTLVAYATDLRQWLDFMAREGIGDGPPTGENVCSFLGTLEHRGQPIERRSQARKLSALRAFYRFLEKRGWIATAENPTRGLRAARYRRRLPRPLRPLELEALLESAATTKKFTAARDRALWETLYSTGMRISEALSLQYADFCHGKIPDELKITGKGRKDRIVFFGSYARQAIADYLPWREKLLRKQGKQCPALFINARGTALTRRGAGFLLRQRLRSLGLHEQITLHSLRHAFATDLLNAGAEIRHVQEMLGHASVSTTQNYTQLAKERLFAIYREAHPHGRGS